MADPKTFQFDLPTSGRPVTVCIPHEWYPRVQDYWPICTSPRSVDPISGIKAIIIHATAGANSAGAVSRMRDGAASFHWLVPDEDESQHGRLVWACVPENLAAWHVLNSSSHPDVNNNKNTVNHWSLGIEIVNLVNGGDAFSPWQVEITAQIVRYCWAKYPNLKHIVSHAKLDPKRRNDPGTNFPWNTFKKLVLNPPNSFAKILSVKSPKSNKASEGNDAVDELHAIK
jgi:N-acetylmuramoyl-L-alanine amidase